MKPDLRLLQLRNWLRHQFDEEGEITIVSGDASFRRYFRLHPQNPKNRAQGEPWILMDAPPDREDCRPFVRIAEILHRAGAKVPRILAQDINLGFLALSDLGDITYLQRFTSHPQEANLLYRQALSALIRTQKNAEIQNLDRYSEEKMLVEMRLFPDWLLAKHLAIDWDDAEITQQFALIVRACVDQPSAWVHRDYHSRNLMVITDAHDAVALQTPAMLDFQDAVVGPLTYDVVSLLRDAYIDWDEATELDWLIYYWQTARKEGLPLSDDFSAFFRDYEWMGLQRQLKVMGIFARLFHRDGKDRYLSDIPRVFGYAMRVCRRYGALVPLARLLQKLEPALLGKPQTSIGYTF